MIDWLRKIFFPKSHADPIEREKIERLESAERDLKDLQARGDRAVQFLRDRHSRNHWREAIEQMIQGVS